MPAITRLSWARSVRSGLALAFLFGISLRCGGENKALLEQEFECEEAVANLLKCCGLKRIAIECVYQEGSSDCGIYSRSPDLNIVTARCLRTASCESIVDHGLCTHPKDAICQ